MRKHSQKLSVLVLIALLAVALAVGLVACNNKNGQTADHTDHTPDAEWHSDDTSHWHLCQEGGEELSKGEHDFVLRNDNEHHYLECTVCAKRKDVDGHNTVVKSDANGHWIECTKEGCSYKTEAEAHELSTTATADADGQHHTYACTYEGCTYAEQYEHSLSYEHIAEGGHHQVCADCDYATAKEDCVKGEDVAYTDAEDGEHHTYVCALCEATVSEEHSDLSSWRSDGDNHYKVCGLCEARVQNEAHTSKAMTTTEQHWTECEVCGEELTQRQQHTKVWKDTADHKQHYRGCEGCDYDFGEHADHQYEAWTTDEGNETCSFTCSLCELTVTDAHDYVESADCARCHYDPGVWTFGENDDDTYTLNSYTQFRLMCSISNPSQGVDKDDIYTIVLPKYYNGKPVTKVAATSDNGVFDSKGGHCYFNLVIPEGYTEIGKLGDEDFGSIYFSDIYLPSTLTNINGSLGNRGPEGSLYIADLEKYMNVEFARGITFPHDFYVKGEDGEYTKITELVIPAGVTELKSYTFNQITSLDSVTFPTGFEKVNASALPSAPDAIGALKFASFADYVKVDWVQTNPVVQGAELDINGEEIPEDLTLDEGIESIAGTTFGASVDGVITAYDAFKGVRKLRLPASMNEAYIYLPDVEELYIPSLDQMFTLAKASGQFFEYMYGDNGLRVFVAGEELTSLTFDAQYTDTDSSKYKYNYNDSLTSLTFTSANLTQIANSAFGHCKNLTSVDFGTHITTIGVGAFDSTGLNGEIKVPEVTTLQNAFANNAGITTLYIPSSVTTVAGGAFYGLTADIVFAKDANVTSLASNAFNRNDSTLAPNSYMGKNIVLPAGSWKLAANMFRAGEELGTLANLSRIYYSGTEQQLQTLKTQAASLAGVEAFLAASVYIYHEEDPGAGLNQLTWHYDEAGKFVAWDASEPDCDRHEFVMTPGEEDHWLQCSKCNYKLQTADHDTKGEIASDEHDHWSTCSICGGRSSEKTAHSSTKYDHDGQGHWGICDACGYATSEPVAHTAKADEWGSDDTSHWNICETCGAKMEDTVTAHTPSEGSYKSGNAEGHAYTCSVCNHDGKEAHTYGDAGDGFKDGICVHCSFSQFTLDASGNIKTYTATDIEKLAIPATINGTQVKGIAAGTTIKSIFADGCGLKEVRLPDSADFTAIGNYAFKGLSTLEYITFNQYVTTLGNQCFYGTGLIELELPDSVTSLGSSPITNCTKLRKLVLGTGVTTVKTLGTVWGNETTIIIKSTSLTGSSQASLFGITGKKMVYLYMDVDAWNAACPKLFSSAGQTTVKGMTIFCKSDEEPADKTLGDYADGFWKLSDEGEPELWPGQEVVVFRNTTIDFDIDSVEADEKTLDLSTNVVLQSCDIAYSTTDSGIVVSGEGVVTATSFGQFTIKATYGKDNTVVELTIRVRSSGIYALGTVGGEEVTAQQDKFTISDDTDPRQPKRSMQFKAGDKFKLLDGAFSIDKAYYPGDDAQQTLDTFYEIEEGLAEKVTVDDDKYISVAEDIWLTITVAFESTSSEHRHAIVVYISKSHYTIKISASAEITNTTLTYDIEPGKTNTDSLQLKASSKINANTTINISSFELTLIDGTKVIYDKNDDHGVTLSGSKYSSTSSTKNKWVVSTAGGLALKFVTTSQINSGTTIGTFNFTFNDDGTIASIRIS